MGISPGAPYALCVRARRPQLGCRPVVSSLGISSGRAPLGGPFFADASAPPPIYEAARDRDVSSAGFIPGGAPLGRAGRAPFALVLRGYISHGGAPLSRVGRAPFALVLRCQSWGFPFA